MNNGHVKAVELAAYQLATYDDDDDTTKAMHIPY
jgi:hypothetical protein